MLTTNQRQIEWLDPLPDSPAKTIACEIADVWETQGQAAAAAEAMFGAKTHGMVRWERLAVSDMIHAFHIKSEVTK